MATDTFSATPDRVKRLTAYGLIVLLIVAFGAWTIFEPFGRDQAIHATIAAGLLNGQTTYAAIYNIKPPITTAIHALSPLLFGHSEASIRLFDLVFVAATGAAMCALLMRLGYSIVGATLAPLAFAAIYYPSSFWHRAQTDGWAGLLIIWALLLLVMGWQSQKARHVFFSGVILALAFSLKYTIGPIALVIFVPIFASDLRLRLVDFLSFAAGGLGTLVISGGLLAVLGAFDAYVEIQTFILSYASGFRVSAQFIQMELLSVLLKAPLFGLAMFIGLALTISRALFPGRDLAACLLVIWLIAGWVSLWIQGKGFPYHALPFLVALAACSASAFDTITAFVRHRLTDTRTQKIVAVIGIVALASNAPLKQPIDVARSLLTGQSPMTEADFYVETDFSSAATAAATEFLQNELQPSETLFVWGYDTGLYFTTNRTPLHRYPYSWPFLVSFYDRRYDADLLGRLLANMPDVVVVQNNDMTPWVTGRAVDSRGALAEFPALQNLIASRYRKIGDSPKFEYYRLN